VSGIQQTDFDPDMPAPVNYGPTGGNSCLTNQVEDDAPAATYENIEVRGPEAMWDENTSHDQGVYSFEKFG
jgi:hypothetical protein